MRAGAGGMTLGAILPLTAAGGGDVALVQTAASAAITTNNPGSVGQAITWGSGTNKVGFACVTWDNTATAAVSGSVSGAWTAVPSSKATNAEARSKNVEWFYKINPTAGAETVTATFTGDADVCHIAVKEFTGVHQTVPNGTPVAANIASGPTTYDHVVTDGAAGDYFVTGMFNGDPSALALMDLTSTGDDPTWEAFENSYWNSGCIGGARAATGSSHTFSYLIEDAGSAISGFAVKKA